MNITFVCVMTHPPLKSTPTPVTGRLARRSLLTALGYWKTPALSAELRPQSNEPQLDPISGYWIHSPATLSALLLINPGVPAKDRREKGWERTIKEAEQKDLKK